MTTCALLLTTLLAALPPGEAKAPKIMGPHAPTIRIPGATVWVFGQAGLVGKNATPGSIFYAPRLANLTIRTRSKEASSDEVDPFQFMPPQRYGGNPIRTYPIGWGYN